MEGQAENEELYPIAVLIDELKVSFMPKRQLLLSLLLAAQG